MSPAARRAVWGFAALAVGATVAGLMTLPALRSLSRFKPVVHGSASKVILSDEAAATAAITPQMLAAVQDAVAVHAGSLGGDRAEYATSVLRIDWARGPSPAHPSAARILSGVLQDATWFRWGAFPVRNYGSGWEPVRIDVVGGPLVHSSADIVSTGLPDQGYNDLALARAEQGLALAWAGPRAPRGMYETTPAADSAYPALKPSFGRSLVVTYQRAPSASGLTGDQIMDDAASPDGRYRIQSFISNSAWDTTSLTDTKTGRVITINVFSGWDSLEWKGGALSFDVITCPAPPDNTLVHFVVDLKTMTLRQVVPSGPLSFNKPAGG